LRWETRLVTLLGVRLDDYSSVPGSTVGDALHLIGEKVKTFGGQITRVSPSGLLAAFGLVPAETTENLAAHAALAILRAARRARWNESAASTLRMGLHTTRLLVAGGAGPPAMDAEAERRAEAVLDELAKSAGPGDVVVSAESAILLRRQFLIVPLPDRPDLGQLVDLRRSRETPAETQTPIRFVGRQWELGILQDRLDSARRGRGQVVCIAGEAGLGKSRLLAELWQRLDPDVTWLEGHCLAFGTHLAYLPLLDLVRGACGISDFDPPAAMVEKVRRAVVEIGLQGDDSLAAFLLHLLGVDAGAEPVAGLASDVIKKGTYEAVRQLLHRTARRQPLIVVIEDLHWIDSASESWLGALVDTVGGSPILVVVTHRPEYRPPWITPSVAEIRLKPLSPDNSLSLVRAVLGESSFPEAVSRAILTRAEGNPFFLEELSRAARDGRGPSGPDEVPDTIGDVLGTRIDRLPDGTASVLLTAAVVGEDVPLRILREVAGLPDETLTTRLGDLQRWEFLVESSVGGEIGLTFKHALTHDVAYSRVPPERRRVIHAKVMDAIEKLLADRLPHVERLARHALLGEAWEKAATYFHEAGAKAFARSANQEAVVCFQQALTAIGHLPETPPVLQEAIDIRLEMRSALFLLGNLDAVARCLHEAAALAERLQDAVRLGRAFAYLCHYYNAIARSADARHFGRQARQLAVESDDLGLLVATNLYFGLACDTYGDYRQAAQLYHELAEALQGERTRQRFGQVGFPAVLARAFLAMTLAELGDFDEGVPVGEEAIRLAEAVDHPYSLGMACWDLAYLHGLRGEFRAALELLARAAATQDPDRAASGRRSADLAELARNRNFRLSAPRTLWLLGHFESQSGQPAEGVALLEEAVQAFEAVGMHFYDALVAAHLGEAYLRVGRLAEARASAERAARLAAECEQRGDHAYALFILGQVAAQTEPPDLDTATALFEQALAKALDLGLRPLAARCRLGLGLLLRGAGADARAREHLAGAITELRRMGMRRWLDQALTALDSLPDRGSGDEVPDPRGRD
jgi:predicted ATPase